METKIIRDIQEKIGDPESPSPFESKVNKAIVDGFNPIGGVSITVNGGFIHAAQTLSKTSESSASNHEYKVIVGLSYADGGPNFETQIRDDASNGWKPQGGVSYACDGNSSIPAQAFVRKCKE